MIKCHLSRILGEKRLKIADVTRDTEINRGTLTRLFYDKTQRVDLDALDKLCAYLDCTISDLLEFIPEEDSSIDRN